jgi:hypothetical protein
MQTLFEGSMHHLRNGPHYHVARVGTPRFGFRYDLTRVDLPGRIGSFRTKGEAVRCARMLAGWDGIVTAPNRGQCKPR